MDYKFLAKNIYRLKAKLISLDMVWYFWVFITNKFNSSYKYYRENPFQIPIVINNFNRLGTLKLMVEQLKRLGYNNIIVIDNGSNYQPLWDYYNQDKAFKLIVSDNLGHRSLFLSKDKFLKKIRKSCFIYTDSDLILNDDLPKNFGEIMFSILLKNNEVSKVGFAIRIEDLQIDNPINKDIIEWEQRYWKNSVGENMYLSSIDTTFALYRPILFKARNSIVRFYKAIRIAGDFTCKHEPWYWDFEKLNEEQKFYFTNANDSSSYINLIKQNIAGN